MQSSIAKNVKNKPLLPHQPFSQIDQYTSIIMSKLISQLDKNNQLQHFRVQFQRRKIYNNYERHYIESQKIKAELDKDYESDEDDDELIQGIAGDMSGNINGNGDGDENSNEDHKYNDYLSSLSKYELKCLLKENLIKTGFDQNKLSYIDPPTPDDYQGLQSEERDLSSNRIAENDIVTRVGVKQTKVQTNSNGNPKQNFQIEQSQKSSSLQSSPQASQKQLPSSSLQQPSSSQLKSSSLPPSTILKNTSRISPLLNVIDEKKEVASSYSSSKNLWALDFFINQLEAMLV